MARSLFIGVLHRVRWGVRGIQRPRRLVSATAWTALLVVGCGRIGYELMPAEGDTGLRIEGGGGGSFEDASPARSGGSSGSGTESGGASSGGAQTGAGGPNGGTRTDAGGATPTSGGMPGAGGTSDAGGTTGGTGGSGGGQASGGAGGGQASGGAGGVSCSPACTNPHGTTACVANACTPTCAARFGSCDGNLANGCEASFDTDTGHCGSCASTCSNAHGTTTCTSGLCTPACSSGFSDCDGNPKNGCEANIGADPAHCGSCSNVCSGATGTPVCNAGVCGVSSCGAGLGDCDKAPANGCETNLQNSVNDCGFCGSTCANANGTTACASSVCKPACSGGFGDCNGDPKDGCEQSTTTASNCGTCGNVCAAALPSCNGGVCSCDLSGAWAAKLTVNVSWPGTAAITGGSGTLQLWGLLAGNQNGNSIPATLLPCGLTLPDYNSSAGSGSEPYGFAFPMTLFDHAPPYLNAAAATVSLSGSVPGSSYSSASFVNLIGLTMTNGATDPWPASYTGIATVDADADTKTAVTGNIKTGGSYLYTPVDGAKSARADRLYISLRVSASLSGSVTSCTQVNGTASLPRFDYHLVGCHVAGAADCNASQTSFVDGTRVAFTPGTGSFTAKKLGGAVTCAAVRAAVP